MPAHLSRRALAVGAAWAVPAVAVGAVAPAFAASTGPRVSGTVTAVQGATNRTVRLTVPVSPLDGRTYTLRILTVTNTVGNNTTWTLPNDTVFTTSPVTANLLKSNAGSPGITWTATYQILTGGSIVSSGTFTFVY